MQEPKHWDCTRRSEENLVFLLLVEASMRIASPFDLASKGRIK
jgi:hypothetical protein